MDEINRLRGRIEALNGAGAFTVRERAQAVFEQAIRVFEDLEARLARLEEKRE